MKLLWYSIQHQPDLAIGVHLMDRYTFYLLEFLEDIQPASKTNMNDLVRVCLYVCVNSSESTLAVCIQRKVVGHCYCFI